MIEAITGLPSLVVDSEDFEKILLSPYVLLLSSVGGRRAVLLSTMVVIEGRSG